MKFLKYFLILFFLSGIFHHPLLESFTRSKRFFSSYFKKPTFKSNFFSKFFTKTRQKFRQFRTKFSFRPFTKFKKYAQKPITKKVTTLTTVAAATLTFKKFIETTYPNEKQRVEQSLSYKIAAQKNLKTFQEFCSNIAKDWIKDPDFASKETINALMREQYAQKNGNAVGYHTMQAIIFAVLDLYTKLYNEKNAIENKENFIYLRTFDAVKNTEGIAPMKFLEKLFYESTAKETFDVTNAARTYIFSMSPWLIQNTEWYESALYIPALDPEKLKNIIQPILKNICTLHNIENNDCVNDLMNLFSENVSKNRILLQVIFDRKTDKPLSTTEYDPNKLNLSSIYVGNNEKNIVENLYWAQRFGLPCYLKLYKSYDGPKMYHEMLYNKNIPKEAEDAQLRAVITKKFLEEGEYRVYDIDLGKNRVDFQNTQKKLITKTKEILQKYQKSSPIKTPEKEINL